MRSGPLRQLLILESPTLGKDSEGAPTETFSPVATVRAEIWTLSGTERQMAAQNQAVVTHRARIRAYSGLTSRWRAYNGGKYFNIRFVNDVNMRGVEMLLDLEEIVGTEART